MSIHDPSVWGQTFWDTLYIVAFTYPLQPTGADKQWTRWFYEVFAHVLPCNTCGQDYARLLQLYPIDDWLKDREALCRWVYNVRNRVNEKMGKPLTPPSFEAVQHYYQVEFPAGKRNPPSSSSGGTTNNKNGVSWGTVFIVVLVAFLLALLLGFWAGRISKQVSTVPGLLPLPS